MTHPETDEGDDQQVTSEMVTNACEQARVDSSLGMTARRRARRMLEAALSGKVDRALLNADLDRRASDPTLTT